MVNPIKKGTVGVFIGQTKNPKLVHFTDYNDSVIKTSLMDSLAQNGLSCDTSASSGDWSKFNSEEKFDLIATSETIYNTEYYPALHGVFERRKEFFLI